MIKPIFASLLCLLLMTTPLFAAEAEQDTELLLKKIKELENQINEMQKLKLKKEALPVKMDQCMRVVGVESYCGCISEALPATVDYLRFVQIMLTPAQELGYNKLPADQQKDIDQTAVAWANCVEYKGPKGKGIVETIMQRDTLF
ncbi:MAG: hypothetical protein RBQ99_05105 [Trichlorobacter sp.]|jgi:Tfp pilus assembly protein PilN|nr:hypothetical protein [Trichlorobacter sp.]